MECHACGTTLSAAARYCHKCGARVGAGERQTGQAADWRAGLPWGLAGAAVGALIAVLALRLGGEQGAGSGGGEQAAAPRALLPAPDISQMSPEERARRLFDRIMTLAERGVQDSVQFFLPMAIGAYGQLPALDLDARYDLGLLYIAAGEAAGALAQADTILRAVPTHLYGFMLRARARELQGDARGVRQAYVAFLRHETAERARLRPEYAEHTTSIDAFRAEALRITGAR
ncbi:MAG: zinc ribbon domain-containing protein [Gemmatimonadales bacterium]